MSNRSCLKIWMILLFLAIACAGNGCRCDSPNALARLTSTSSPEVQLDRVTQENLWRVAPMGSEFFLGDGIRTGASSTAELSLRHNAKLHVQPSSVVRFLSAAADSNVLAIDIEMGDAILETTSNSFKISTRLGAAIIEKSSKIRLKGSPKGLEIIVDYGQISIDNPKVTAPLTAGQHVKLELNVGAVELAPSDSAAPVASSPGNTEGVEIAGRGPTITDLTANAGESFTVHDPHPPTAIALLLPSICPDGAILRVGPKKTSGIGSLSAALSAGTHRYAIHCLSESGPNSDPAASGTITVLSDLGTPPGPRGTSSASVGVDGRRYKILFENRLPDINVSWNNAPSSEQYSVQLSGPGGTRIRKGASPSFAFPSGTIRQGVHQVYIEAIGLSQRRSRTSTISLEQQAPTPRVGMTSPPLLDLQPGESATIKGELEEGWSVSINGTPVVPSAGRFEETLQVPSNTSSIPIVFKHPQQGTHYYLRRIKGAQK